MAYCSVDLFSSAIVSAIYRRRAIAVPVCQLISLDRLHWPAHAARLLLMEPIFVTLRCSIFSTAPSLQLLSLLSGSFNPHSRPAV
jgi:hypothetical protein